MMDNSIQVTLPALPTKPRGSRHSRRPPGSFTRAAEMPTGSSAGSSASGSRPSVRKAKSELDPVFGELPTALWGIIAAGLLPREFACLLAGRRHVVPDVFRSRLWRFFCHFAGFVRMPLHESVQQAAYHGECSHGGGSSCSSDSCFRVEVDWETLFKSNAWATVKGKHLSSWIRVGPEELRLAIPRRVALSDAEAAAAPTDLWDGFCSADLLRRALRLVLLHGDDDIRIRELVMGREGMLLKHSAFFKGESTAGAVLECPTDTVSPSGKTWRLPPTMQQQDCEVDAGACVMSQHMMARRGGWIIELAPFPEDSQAETALPTFLEAIRFGTRWLHVAAEKAASAVTVRDLCKAISVELELLGEERLDVWPASMQNPMLPADEVQPGWELVRDLRWTQSEKLLLREVRVPYHPETDKWKFDSEECAGSAQRRVGALSCAQAKPRLHRVVVFERCALRLPAKERSTKCATRWTSASACLAASLAALPMRMSSGQASEDRTPGSVLDRLTDCVVDPPTPSSSSRCCSSDVDQNTDSGIAHSRQLQFTTSGVRQFEFHPVRPEILLLGKKSGTAEIVDHETDTQTHSTQIDVHPILGLSWLNQHPQRAVVAASQSGVIKFLRYDELNHGKMESVEMDSFAHLSSLSMNCTDDYFMTSGFCTDVGLYDVFTGRRINTFQMLHHNFINILRFAHRTPHVFSTASFDNTCKVWDLREPIISGHKPVMCLSTGALNVMCCFCPDDSRVLVSGVDDALREFDLRQGGSMGTKFPVPAMNSSINYRRSLYLAGGRVVASVATNETLLRLYDAGAPHRSLGQIDFRNMSMQKPEPSAHVEVEHRRAGRLPALSWRNSSVLPRGASMRGVSARPEEPTPATARPEVEYLQSLRCHPTDPTLLGAIVAASEPTPESLVTTIRFEKPTGGIVGG